MKVKRQLQRLLILQCLLAVLLCSLPYASLVADTFSDRRALVSFKLFRTLIGADQDLAQKKDNDGHLNIYLLYTDNEQAAKDFAIPLAESLPSVRDIPIKLDLLPLQTINSLDKTPMAIFVSQPLSDAQAAALVAYSIKQHIIVFSPFEGDVERGILAGLSVEATVKPLLNRHTLEASELQIKSFYLKVAKLYE